MLYNIRYWWFFLSQGNRWTKYFVHPKILRPKPCLQMFASLVILDDFHLLLLTQLTADLTPEWSGRSMFHLLFYIYAKTHFCCVETVANNALIRLRFVVLDRLWTNAAPTSNTAFSLTNVHAKSHLLISSSSLLSHATTIYDRPKRICGVFGVLTDNCRIRSTSFVSVRLHLKSAYHLLTAVSDGAESA